MHAHILTSRLRNMEDATAPLFNVYFCMFSQKENRRRNVVVLIPGISVKSINLHIIFTSGRYIHIKDSGS